MTINKKQTQMADPSIPQSGLGEPRGHVDKNYATKSGSVAKITVYRPFGILIDNFYMTDFVCENSATMAKASKLRLQNIYLKEKSIYN